MRILHATDFSHTAELSRALAVDLQRRSHGALHVVHVQERFEQRPGRAFLPAQADAINPELQRRLEEERKRETDRLRTRLARFAEEGATSELVWGEPLRELLRLAPSFDLVVMGAHGAQPFDGAFLGGVAGRLVRRSTTPVLTVRDACSTKKVARVMVATDFQEAALAAWTFALDLQRRTGVELLLAHVDESRDGDAQVPQRRLEALSAGRAARLVLERGNPIEVLPDVAERLGVDVIAVGMRRHRAIAGLLMGARADALVRSSRIPILSVPAS